MASIIEGYNYDIFISYRQKDNKYDGWITEFVDNLKTELDATFKEEVSVYFDINPYDGLLETHSVDKSLLEKLKSAIFVPIISQTYCDSKSYAWQNELCIFNKLAKEDRLGRDIRLISGNVANRILPVKIHDLDPEDRTLFENEIGEVLRCVEFIYKQPGVNRPLKPDDNKKDNINKTAYRDQINKIANAIKEILYAAKSYKPGVITEKVVKGSSTENKGDADNDIGTIRKSIIVLPFANMSPNQQDEYFSDGLTEEIITFLAHLKSLRVISRSTSMVLKTTSKDIITIGQELNVEYVLEGSVRKSENKIRITAQLIKASTDEHLWAERYDGTMDDIFDVQDKIAKKIVDALKIELSPVEKKVLAERPISNPKAYDLMILAKSEFHKLNKEGIERGIFLIKKAIEIEGDNAKLYATLGDMYWLAYDIGIKHEIEIFELMEQCVSRSLSLDPNQSEALSIKGLILYKKGDLPGYIKYTLPAVEYGSDNVAQLLIPFILAELGRLKEAHKYSDNAIKSNPLEFIPWFINAFVDVIDGKPEIAKNKIRDARDRLAPGESFAGWWVAQIYAYAGEKETAYQEFMKVASSNDSPWKELSKVFQLAIESNRIGITEHINNSGITDFCKTDEYYPLFIANALTLVGEYDNALVWLKRSVDWGFSNHKFLIYHNRFLEPLRDDLRFLSIVDQARKQQEAFKD